MGKGIGSLVFDSASIQCVEEEKQGAIDVQIMFLTLYDQRGAGCHRVAVHSHQLYDFVGVVGIVGQRLIY